MNARINLNTYVAVILTDFGAQHYNKYKAQFSNKFYVYEPVHKGHQIRYPLWELMNIFGPVLTMGNVLIPFEGNLIEFLR